MYLKLFWQPHCAAGILCQREVMSRTWKRRPVIRSTAHNPLPLQQLLLVHSLTLSKNGPPKPEFIQFCWGRHLHSPLPTSYQYTVVGKYYTLCVQIVWLLGGANWHEAPWKPDLFTSRFLSGQSIKLAFTCTAKIKIIFGLNWYHLRNK